MILDIQSQLDIIHKIRKGDIKEGLGLGVKLLDQHFRFKEEFGIIGYNKKLIFLTISNVV